MHREVCVIGKAGKETFTERPPFQCYIVLRVASDGEYQIRHLVSLSVPSHRTHVDFSSEVPLFERVGRVLRWSWRKSVAVAVSSIEKNCQFNRDTLAY